MEHESTLKFVTNLDRAGIEGELAKVRQKAADRNLGAISDLLSGVEGQPREALNRIIAECIAEAGKSPEHRALKDQLELVQINLPNLG